MSSRNDRSPTFWCSQSKNTENVPRKSRREQSMEGSRLPTYRRSKSSALLSTAPVKGNQAPRGRSCSSNRDVLPQQLFASSSHKPLSQRHGLGAASKFSTPMNQQRMQRFSGSTNRLTINKISPWMKHSGNKEVQKKEMTKEHNRILQILAHINCNVQLTKPVALRDFVSILICLFDAMQLESQLTFANYVTVVPLLMKKLFFTGNCSTSMLKTVNTGHSWPHVLTLISYLCDVIEPQLNADSGLTKPNAVEAIFRNTICKLVIQSNESKIPESFSQFTSDVIKCHGVDINKLEKRKVVEDDLLKEIEKEEKTLNVLQTEYNRRKAVGADIEIKWRQVKEKMERNEVEYENKQKATTEEIEELDLHISASANENVLLMEQLKKQIYSKDHVLALHEEINDIAETCELQEERNTELEAELNQISLECSKVHGQLKAAAIAFNSNLSKMFTSKAELQDIMVPESGFRKYSQEEFDRIISNCLTAFTTVHSVIYDFKKNIIESEKEHEKKLCILEDLKITISRVRNTKNHELELKKRENKKFIHELEELDKKLKDKRGVLLSLLDKAENVHMEINQYTQISAGLDKKEIELETIFKQNKKKSDQFLSETLLDITNYLQQYENDYRNYLIKQVEMQKKINELKKSFREDE